MKRILVKFDEADQIINFVRIINQYEYDADVKCGSRIVDAKSIVPGPFQGPGADSAHRRVRRSAG